MNELSCSCFRSRIFRTVSALLAVLFAVASTGVAAQVVNGPTPVVRTVVQATQLRFEPRIAYASATLRIVGPSGFAFERAFGTGAPIFDLASVGARLADGQYRYELTLVAYLARRSVPLSTPTRFATTVPLAAPRSPPSSTPCARPTRDRFSWPAARSWCPRSRQRPRRPALARAAATRPRSTIRSSPTTSSCEGSPCVGLDCVNNESFGFETIVVKENDIRITSPTRRGRASRPTTGSSPHRQRLGGLD